MKKPVESVGLAKPTLMVVGSTFDEQHYTIAQLAKKWNKSLETIRKIVCVEPGVLKFSGGSGKRTTYSVPESVAKRIHTRMSI